MMMLKMIVSALTFYSVDSQMALIGGIQDSHGCVTDGGYQWCEHTQSCIRPWTTPCEEVVQAPSPPPVPGPAPSPAPLCSGIMCMMYCEHGHELDDNGCPMCQCRTVASPPPVPPPALVTASENTCDLDHVCPKVSVVSHNGVQGYTTYRLSLVLKSDVKDVYAIYGDSESGEMYFPEAYQEGTLGSNFGGIKPMHLTMNPRLAYDSWLTVGLTDGDMYGKLASVGIDFDDWTASHPLVVNNGAVFSLDSTPSGSLMPGSSEYVVAQLTLRDRAGFSNSAVVHAQGNMKDSTVDDWSQTGIHFTMSSTEATGHRRTQDMPPIAIDPMPPVVDPGFGVDISVGVSEGGRCASGFCENAADCPQCQAGLTCVVPADMMCAGTCYGTCHAPPSALPTPSPTPPPTPLPLNPDCVVWNDGCNTCQVRDGQMVGCTRMMCFHQGTPHCLVYGHH